MASTLAPSLGGVPEVRFAAAGALVLPLAVLCHRLGAGVAPAVAVEAVLCVLVALTLPTAYAAGLGLSAWACVTGFGVNDLGALTFDRADLERLLAMVVVATLAATLAHRPSAPRAWSGPQPIRPASASPSARPDR